MVDTKIGGAQQHSSVHSQSNPLNTQGQVLNGGCERGGINMASFLSKIIIAGTFLVVQWLRICLPVPRTQVQFQSEKIPQGQLSP